MVSCAVCPGEIAKKAASSAVDGLAKAMTEGLGKAVKTLFTFWTDTPNPDLEKVGGPVDQLRDATWWVTCTIAVVCLLIAAARMVLTRSGRPAGEAASGFITLIVVSAASIGGTAAAMRGSDALSAYIISAADAEALGGRVGALTVGMTPVLGPGLAIIVALLALLVSLCQMALLVIRGGVLVVLVGILPLTAAAAVTPAGSAWFRKTLAWIAAFMLFKPAAAIAYTAAFLLIEDGTSAVDILRGLSLICLSILALPALLRTITPAVSAMSSGGGGGARPRRWRHGRHGDRRAHGGLPLKGCREVRALRPSAAPSAPTGAAGHGTRALPPVGGAAAGSAGRGSGAGRMASAAAGPAGAAMHVGAQVVSAGRRAANKTLNDTSEPEGGRR